MEIECHLVVEADRQIAAFHHARGRLKAMTRPACRQMKSDAIRHSLTNEANELPV
jgi:hypothetical protein